MTTQSASQVHQLVQAMSTFDAAADEASDFNVQPEAYLYRENLLASVHVSAHLA